MKIGFLHSVKLHLGDIGNAKVYRIMQEDWLADPDYWLDAYYGLFTNRSKLRGLIYDYRPYEQEFADFKDYDLIALSLNFDNYSSNFHKFVTAIINDLYVRFPVLYRKEVIILAGNEVWEKRRNIEKFVQVVWDTAIGIRESIKPELPICMWNQKIRTLEEKEALKEIINNDIIKSCCKYFGYQSLGTEPEIARQFIRLAQLEEYIIIDTELMTETYDSFLEIKTKFEVNQLLGVPIVFIGCPEISEELGNYDEMFKKYALQIGTYKKDKQKIIQFVQEYKDKKEVLNKMFDDILLGICYVKGTRGWGVKRLQKIYNKWLGVDVVEIPILEDGLFGTKTKNAIKYYQTMNNLGIDGRAGEKTMTSMMNFMLKRYNK